MGSVQNKANNSPSDDRHTAIIVIEDDSDDEFVDCSNEIISNNLDSSSSEIISSSDGNSRTNDDEIMKIKQNLSDDDDEESTEERKERQQRELEEFREEINRKREIRQQCMQKLRAELTDLREKLANEMMINERLREERGTDKSLDDLIAENKRLKIELSECQMYLQTSNTENINATLETQALRDHIRSLKEVIKATKEMLSIRELQVDQMKSKLTEIETSFADKEAKIMSTALQQEYQRQLENIRNMRTLYEQRTNLIIQERNSLQRQLDDKELDLRTEIEKYVKENICGLVDSFRVVSHIIRLKFSCVSSSFKIIFKQFYINFLAVLKLFFSSFI